MYCLLKAPQGEGLTLDIPHPFVHNNPYQIPPSYVQLILLVSIIVRKTLILALFLCIGLTAMCQDDAADKRGLLMNACAFEPEADALILYDRGVLTINNDCSLHLDRQLCIKFFKDKKIDKTLSDIAFYPSSSFAQYARFTITTIDIDPTTKGIVNREVTTKVTNLHLDQSTIRMRKGMLLKISYTINFPYDEKIPDWRFQQASYPTDFTSLKLSIPEPVTLKTSLEGSFTPDISNSSEVAKQTHISSEMAPLKVRENEYQFNQLPSQKKEAFSGNSPSELERLAFHVVSVTQGGTTKKDFCARQVDKIVETLSIKADYLPRLSEDLPIKADYDRRIKSLTDPEEKIARIYDLVRRHITWDRIDTFSARSLAKVWQDKKGNSTEINLALVKVLTDYGYDASPMLVSTRANGQVDTANVALSDFDRTVAYLKLGEKVIVLDATSRYFDYPLLSSGLLNSTGLLISMDLHRWVQVTDNKNYYKNSVILLGHLMGDTTFMTNVYVNSTGYAKAEHVEIYERDSLKGIRNYFERGNKAIHFKHFIVANEYVDTLPLAQEFDIRIPPVKTDNLYGIAPTSFAIPDTLFTISEDRKSPVNFGYRQQYDLVSECSFPERYEIYLMPNNVSMSSVNGNVHYEREYHNNSTNFSMKQTLLIDKSNFTLKEAAELAKFLRKIDNLQKQQVVLKRLN
ncbi:MAG: hypothetical protein JWO03_1380 [Bacteroidetes bacterium]|nr:hypothetical protein [Bacteroidota bacterium]